MSRGRPRLAGPAWVAAWALGLSVPDVLGRELSTDRPDATESPFTVEPGRVQLEASVASYTRDRHRVNRDDARVTIWNIAPVNVRIGLTASTELQVVVDNYFDVEVDSPDSGLRRRDRGWGDVTLRFKRNLWGNDDGESGLGIMPFVKLPTGSSGLGNDAIEGGILLPFATGLSGGWSLGAMTEVDVVRNDEDNGYDVVWLNTATVAHELTDQWGVFFEVAVEVGAGKPAATFNTGATYAVSDDIQLDAGVFFGLTRAAPDLTLFAGFTTRF